jgi:hypothetical protein
MIAMIAMIAKVMKKFLRLENVKEIRREKWFGVEVLEEEKEPGRQLVVVKRHVKIKGIKKPIKGNHFSNSFF